jgi:acetamidase/formamidase
VITYRPAADELHYTFAERPPVATVKPGELLEVWTLDCFGGLVRTESDLPSRVCDLGKVNPVSGPFYVQGAEPGDTLALHFRSIVPSEDWGVSSTFPHFGALTSSHETATLQPALEERVWRYKIENFEVTYEGAGGQWRLPLDPMHGTVGLAPGGGQAISSLTSGPHGGNLDTPEIRAGVTLYLGVNVAGALFGLGDGHARQGEGEACGVGVECAMTTTVAVELVKGVATPWPRIENDEALLSIGAVRPLEDAYRISHVDMTRWVQELTGFAELDAYQFLSQAGTARIGNVCDPAYTVLARLEKRFLPGSAQAYGGVHARLRGA